MSTSSSKSIFKPVAFVLSKEKIVSDVDFFSDKISDYTIEFGDWCLKVWFIGDCEISVEDKINFSFAFPKSKSLLDRNLVISMTKKICTIENDWLGSIPVFYSKTNNIISTIPNLCLKDTTFDEEGLVNFLEFGYSVFERTAFKNVEFLRYYSKLTIEEDKITVELKDDPVSYPMLFSKQSTPEEAIGAIKEYITEVEQKVKGDIIIPTSGGYDSRLLNWAVNERSRIRAFTYGLSKNQKKSYEVVFAQKICQILNIKWKRIELSNYNNYIDGWHKMFGFSTHLHGMYQLEFYEKITACKDFCSRSTLLSGIVGDLWAGSIKKVDVFSERDVKKLGYTHGIYLDKGFFKSGLKNAARERYFEQHKEAVKDPIIQVVSTIRMKMILLSYLTSVPEYFGIPVWTPFLNFDIATTMLRLPKEEREGREWQKKLFRSQTLDVENMNLKYSSVNSLNHSAAEAYNFDPVQVEIFDKVLDKKKLKKLNRKINNPSKFLEFFLATLKLRSVLRRFGIDKVGYLGTLSNYYVLKAIEKSMKNEC